MAEKIMVRCECIESTACDINYYEQGRVYTVDMQEAKDRDIWRYFNPLEEIPERQVREQIEDEKVERVPAKTAPHRKKKPAPRRKAS